MCSLSYCLQSWWTYPKILCRIINIYSGNPNISNFQLIRIIQFCVNILCLRWVWLPIYTIGKKYTNLKNRLHRNTNFPKLRYRKGSRMKFQRLQHPLETKHFFKMSIRAPNVFVFLVRSSIHSLKVFHFRICSRLRYSNCDWSRSNSFLRAGVIFIQFP